MYYQVNTQSDNDKIPNTEHVTEDVLFERYPFLKDIMANKGNFEVKSLHLFDPVKCIDIWISADDYHQERRMHM